MRKILYISFISLYVLLGIFGAIGNAYIENNGGTRILKNNLFLIILITLIVATIVSYYFPKFFSRYWTSLKKTLRGALIVLFLILSLTFTINVFVLYNCIIGPQSVIIIDGIIERKWTERGTKGNRSYYIGIKDTVTDKYFEFRVKKSVFKNIGEMRTSVSKEFKKGSLGVYYRKNL